MDRELKELLLELDLNELEIEDIKNIEPMIEVISCEDFVINCKLLVDYGYPEIDIDILVLANPNIFVRSSADLENDLIELSKNYADIETALKDDPYII